MPQLPPAYRWIDEVRPLPRMVAEALRLHGTVERSGAADNPVILGWAKEAGLSKAYSSDAVPWCGLFLALVAKRAGKAAPAKPLWARSWSRFGIASPQAALGDVLVFSRARGGGHVGLYVGEDETAFHVLGGNQADAVSIVRIAKSRCIAIRRPIYRVQPASVAPVHLAASGVISTDEA
ncbi:TIGR02594 family protein [Brevundimonas sp.]|uniref:TIGR02594 family protein n=1 Tax=Brevundimonas sp. TaxID=1871086 RepID=UPI003A929B1F